MKITLTHFVSVLFALLCLPFLALAQEEGATGALAMAISLGYYLSTAGFIVATILMALAMRQFGASILGSIFTYFFIGTASFLAITVFQGLGADYFQVSDESMDVWWHILFYLSMFSFYLGLRALVNLGTADPATAGKTFIPAKVWGIISAMVIVFVFLAATPGEGIVSIYDATLLAQLGLHHFLSFILAAIIGSYIYSAKKNLGQIGKAIANPMLIAIWALSLQHLWELQFESWHTVDVTSEVGEGGEKIFLTIAALGFAYAAWRLRSNAKG